MHQGRRNDMRTRPTCSLDGRIAVVGYVQRVAERHIFSMRKADAREIAKYQKRLSQS